MYRTMSREDILIDSASLRRRLRIRTRQGWGTYKPRTLRLNMLEGSETKSES